MRSLITEIKSTINVMYLNHPQIIPTPSPQEKLPSVKQVPSGIHAHEYVAKITMKENGP